MKIKKSQPTSCEHKRHNSQLLCRFYPNKFTYDCVDLPNLDVESLVIPDPAEVLCGGIVSLLLQCSSNG